MRKVFLFFVCSFLAFAISAQPGDSIKSAPVKADTVIKNWTKGGVIGMNFSQSSFTNWAAGGENSLSTTLQINLFSNYKKDKTVWDNSIDLAYGLLKSGEAPFRKNEDKIDFSSKYGRYAFLEHWYYSAMVNFKSQFDNGYNYPNDSTVISHFLAPGYLLIALGLDYKTKDNSLSLFLSPATTKMTFVNDEGLANGGAYGVTPAVFDTINGLYTMTEDGLLVKYEIGGYLKFTYKKDIMKNVNLSTKLELFSNYLKDPQNIDVNWEVLIGMKINKFINASISTNMIYDHDIPVPVTRTINGVEVLGTGPRLQFKEVLAIGIAYKF